MNRTRRILYSLALLAGLTLFFRPASVFAAEDDDNARLDRLENRVNEMAHRQEQMMRRMSAATEQQDRLMQPGRPGFNPPSAPSMEQCPAPACQDDEKAHCCHGALIGLILLVAMVINILIATWIYSDIRKRNEGSGIFIALALLVGIPTAIIYAIVRIGDKKT